MKTSVSRISLAFSCALVVLGAAALLAGCHMGARKAGADIGSTKPHVPAPLDLAKCRPNELGDVPVLEYHELTMPGQSAKDYQYPIEDFRSDMQRLYDLGYRPIGLTDFVRGRIDCPAGKSPVVITFDDASRGQVEFDSAGNLVPDCAAGVLMEMHDKYADWPLKATFFVLPMRGTEEYFYDRRYSTAKLHWLVDHGFELGNHTIHHQPGMNHFTDERVQMEFAEGAALIDKYVPGYNVDTLALPFGVYPHNHSLVRSGSYSGLTYHNICAMRASYRPSYSPADKQFEPYDIYRILPGSGNCKLNYWLDQLQKNSRLYPKYISDGDPLVVTVPDSLKGDLVAKRLANQGLELRTYSDTAPATAPS